MAYRGWGVKLDDAWHTVEVRHAPWVFAKRTIIVDDAIVHESRRAYGSRHEISLGSHAAAVRIAYGFFGYTYELLIDGQALADAPANAPVTHAFELRTAATARSLAGILGQRGYAARLLATTRADRWHLEADTDGLPANESLPDEVHEPLAVLAAQHGGRYLGDFIPDRLDPLGWLARHRGALALVVLLALALALARGTGLFLSLLGLAWLLFLTGLFRPATFAHVFRRRSRLLSSVAFGALVIGSCLPIGLRADGSTEFRAAAERLFRELTVEPTARVYAYDTSFAAGTEVLVEPDFGEPIRVSAASDTFFFFIDDEPGMRFAHRVRYVLVDASGARAFDHAWLPTVNGLRWMADLDATVAGRRITLLANLDWPTPPLHGAPLPEMLVVEASAVGGKIALVIDGSERQTRWYDDVARKFDEDAAAMAESLSAEGYDVRRFGGFRGNVLPAAKVADVEREVARIAREVGPGGEVAIYFGGHGNATGFAMYDQQGERSFIRYADLGAWLGRIDAAVTVRVVIDSCRSGGAVEHLEKRRNTVVVTATDAAHTAPIGLSGDASFTASVVAGRRAPGADLDRDGAVTLGESLAFARSQHERNGATFASSPGAPPVPVPVTGPVAQPAPRPSQPAQPQPQPTPQPQLSPVVFPPAPAPLVFIGSTPAQAAAGIRYEHSFCVPTPATATSPCGPWPPTSDPSGGQPPYHFQLDSGVGFPPIGVSLSKDGVLTGTPAEETGGRTYTFSVCAVDLAGRAVCRRVSLVVQPPPTPPVDFSLVQRPPTCTPVYRPDLARSVHVLEIRATASGPVDAMVWWSGSGSENCGAWGYVSPGICLRGAADPATTEFSLQFTGPVRLTGFGITLYYQQQERKRFEVTVSCP